MNQVAEDHRARCPHCGAERALRDRICGACGKPLPLMEVRWTRHLITAVLISLIPAVFVFRYSWQYAQDLNSRSTAVAAVAYGFYVFVIFFAATASFFLGTDWLRINRRDD